jgi:DNA repair protein RadC
MQASQADMIVTKRIKEGLKLLDINLLDHIILGNNKESISMQEKGLI